MIGLLMDVEQLVEWELADQTEVLGKYTPVPLFPPQIPHDVTCNQTLATTVGSDWPPKLGTAVFGI
jgi:hypothetical protein